MARTAYVNGRYLLHEQAGVHIEDRGYQFSDGIYEYIAFYNRTMLDGDAHLQRMQRSLKELAIPMPMSLAALRVVIDELIARNGRDDGGLYIQVTRGVARRDHPFPKDTKPSLVMTVCAAKIPSALEAKRGVSVISHADQRWARRDIKSISLLANVLAKQQAVSKGCKEAWLVEDGNVTEGAVSNSYIVTHGGVLVTHPANEHILGGITRQKVLELAKQEGIAVEERHFTIDDAYIAAEAFLTSTSVNVLPVVRIDRHQVADGKPGAITKRLAAAYRQHIKQQTGKILP